MKCRIAGLRETTVSAGNDVPDGVYLVRVDRAHYRWHHSVLEPREIAGRAVSGRLYCTARAMWKLGWFLRDFLYDPDLLSQEEVDEKALSGLRGVVKISHTTVHGISLLNFDGFAPASQWPALSSASTPASGASEVAR
jgi:hypothetical protein